MESNKKIILSIVGVVVVILLIVAGYYMWKSAEVTNPNQPNTPTSQQMTVTGTYVCLPHKNTSGPQTLECALGLQESQTTYYALDTQALNQGDFTKIMTGDRITVSGLFTPVEALSSNQWQKYNMRGIISVTSVSAVDRTVVYNCSANKGITAVFHIWNDDSVDVRLTDGRSMTLPRVISASGARYANSGETFVFWNKGDTAFVTEGSPAKETFSNCSAEGFNVKG